jgi:prevent-host-death family protein
MKSASISQTKNQLSALIDQVRQGETIVITDHDRPVAKLVPAHAENGEEATGALAHLERKGIIRRGHGAPCRLAAPLKTRGGASALAALLEDRDQGR